MAGMAHHFLSGLSARCLLFLCVLCALCVSLGDAACAEVDSDTEAVAGQDFKLGCISCKMRGEVEASATADWFFKARGETEFAHVSNLCVYTVYIQYRPKVWTHLLFFNGWLYQGTDTINKNSLSHLKSTRGTASIVSEIMMYVSIIGLQLWLLVEMIYCYRKIAAAGDEALRASAAEYLAIASESKDNCAGVQVAE
uniref:Sodium channel, voltage-gated, type I, beta b n=1 Tax=Astyanax mexicanus TaxID=7994 RepID=A0A8B9KAI0_ASTMX